MRKLIRLWLEKSCNLRSKGNRQKTEATEIGR